MTDWAKPMAGGCRCGQVRFHITAPPLLTSACHCFGRQRMTGSAFSLSIGVASDGFAVTRGMPEIGGLHGPEQRHHHCGRCKSWLFTRIEPDAGFVNVRATMFDDAHGFVPFVEFWTRDKLPWANTPATHSYATQPEMEAFPALLKEFAATQRSRQ